LFEITRFQDYQIRYAKHPGDSPARRDETSFEETRGLAATDIQHADQTLREMGSTTSKTESQSDLVYKENRMSLSTAGWEIAAEEEVADIIQMTRVYSTLNPSPT